MLKDKADKVTMKKELSGVAFIESGASSVSCGT
jgi:hypothetical protein